MIQASDVVQSGWSRGSDPDSLITREWLVTNGLGGYASGTIGGACTRRFHGLLVAALPAPHARTMMFNHLEESLTLPDGRTWHLSADEHAGGREVSYPEEGFLEEFVLEGGLPLWRFAKEGIRLEKRIVMPHLQNTTYVIYRLLEGPAGLVLNLRPALHFRPHEGLLTDDRERQWRVEECPDGLEIFENQDYPPLRLRLLGSGGRLERDETEIHHVLYRIEKSRGYDNEGPLWSPGVIRIGLSTEQPSGFIASTERWEVMEALTVDEAFESELTRRRRLLEIADGEQDPFAAQLILAADQFLIQPATRVADAARAHAAGESPRTVIAGYHWFTDWGRDTMISLEGLTLVTGRNREAGRILRTFASYVRDGLIPNMFPEGQQAGLYHTADASMWFFHALYRYVHQTQDFDTLKAILPKLTDIIDHHLKGTRFNIHVDPDDGLLSQGEEGYQLTWMDAKVDGWVVTPRRGKAVEINALYYNALCILESFLRTTKDEAGAMRIAELAERVRTSFNARFWNRDRNCLYDLVDVPGGGNDASIRPNQVFALSLDFPVLDPSRWEAVMDVARMELLTPFGLRSLSPDNPDYKATYDGDLRARDAAYHQGTVWAWLIGPFIDAWLRVHPDELEQARGFLAPFHDHLGEACIGTISEIFDAQAPFHPRGCAAQAWSVAEVLRCLVKVDRLQAKGPSARHGKRSASAGDAAFT